MFIYSEGNHAELNTNTKMNDLAVSEYKKLIAEKLERDFGYLVVTYYRDSWDFFCEKWNGDKVTHKNARL